ncbi:flagellar hook-length control protein FliK [Pseudoalteromonas mariniglutinosa]|uniref:flagellar hook-length control protein FliK n=1 Tax=Pseudoalteromonas mariniglutinosa TaxID=206042 RepID=UPI00384FC3DD
MNKQSPVTLTKQINIEANNASSANRHAQTSAALIPNGENLHARNIVFAKHSVHMEVMVNNSWQTLRLAIEHEAPRVDKILAATISLSQDGKQLSITPSPISLSLTKTSHLQALLNLLTQNDRHAIKPLPAEIATQKTALMIPSLRTEIALNKMVTELLINETPLKAIILPASAKQAGFMLNIINRYGDTLHQQPVSSARISQLLAKLAPQLTLALTTDHAVISSPTSNTKLTIPFKELMPQQAKLLTSHSQLSNTPLMTDVVANKAQLQLSSHTKTHLIVLKNALSETFQQLLKQQTSNDSSSRPLPIQPLSSAQSPIKSWLQHSFADLKTRVADAVRYFEHRAPLKQTVSQQSTSINSHTTLLKLNKIDIIAHAKQALPNAANSQFAKALPLVQLLQQLQSASTTIEQQYVKTPPITTPLKPLTGKLTRTSMLPLATKLLTPLLKANANKLDLYSLNRYQLTNQIEKLSHAISNQAPDLNRLVNHAFDRLISSQNIHANAVQREVLSIAQPKTLNTAMLQSSFTQALEQLTVTFMAAPLLNSPATHLSINKQTGIDALLQVLVPNFKPSSSAKLLEQIQQPTVQALTGELTQLKSALSSVQTTPINQQPESNPLVQFFLPMKLPPEAGQTEITLGQYKKPNKHNVEGKNVWFIRLNFDYADLGQLQITAELMDSAVDCQLLASSQAVTALAHPHLETLRHKLSSHGLQVGEVNLSQGSSQHQAFYQSHAIINIKV